MGPSGLTSDPSRAPGVRRCRCPFVPALTTTALFAETVRRPFVSSSPTTIPVWGPARAARGGPGRAEAATSRTSKPPGAASPLSTSGGAPER